MLLLVSGRTDHAMILFSEASRAQDRLASVPAQLQGLGRKSAVAGFIASSTAAVLVPIPADRVVAPLERHAARGDRSGGATALFAYECQSFLDNVIAGFASIGAWNDPRGVPALARVVIGPNGRVEVSSRCPALTDFVALNASCPMQRAFI
jgi:hypothetical protein